MFLISLRIADCVGRENRLCFPPHQGLARRGSVISGVLEPIGDPQRYDPGCEMGADRRDHLQCIGSLLIQLPAVQPDREIGKRSRRQVVEGSEPEDRRPAVLLVE